MDDAQTINMGDIENNDNPVEEDMDDGVGHSEPEANVSKDTSRVKTKISKKAYPQKFRKEWLTDPQLWYWIVEVPKVDGGSGAECKFCQTYLSVKYCDLKAHALTKKHQKNVQNAPKQQLLVSRPAPFMKTTKTHDFTESEEVEDLNHSEGVVAAQTCEFVVQQRDAPSHGLSSNQTVKISFPYNSTTPENYDLSDLIKFDVNNDSDTSKHPWPHLEEKYFAYTGICDDKVSFVCKLCSSPSYVKCKKDKKTKRWALCNLKNHIKNNHMIYWDEFRTCVKVNSNRFRKKYNNPWPFLEENYYMFTGSVDENKLSYKCILCRPMKSVRGTRQSMYNLKCHIQNKHPSEWEEFQSLVKANVKPGRPRTSKDPQDPDSQLHIKVPKTRGKKLDLNISDDESMYDDDVADPDFEVQAPDFVPHDSDSPDNHSPDLMDRDSPDLIDDELPANRTKFRPTVVQAPKKRVSNYIPGAGRDLSRFVPLFDRVLVQREETFTQILTKDGVLIPPQANTARVVAVGTGIRSDSGEMIPLEVSVGDEVLIPEYGATKVELDGNDYLLYRDIDLLAKFKSC